MTDKPRGLKKMHISKIYNRAMKGCPYSMTEMIDRQQDNRGLRYYPNGRDGPEDEGICPIQLTIDDGIVTVRSGRPSKAFVLDKEVANKWIIGVAECTEIVIAKHSKNGMDAEEVRSMIVSRSTPGFDCQVESDDELNRVHCLLTPSGLPRWKLSVEDAASFVTQAVVAAAQLEWTLYATEEELESVKLLTDDWPMVTWEIIPN